MTARLTKYPVTSPSGAVYRVVADEVRFGTAYRVKVYTYANNEWKHVRTETARKDRATLSELTRKAIATYEYTESRRRTEKAEKQAAEDASLRQFNEWDGVIR